MVTLYTKRLIIVVSAAAAAVTNARAKEIDSEGGEQTFTVGLSATGKEPITHYWCSWAMSDNEHDAMQQKLLLHVTQGEAKIFDGNKLTSDEVLQQMGLQRVAVIIDN